MNREFKTENGIYEVIIKNILYLCRLKIWFSVDCYV